MADQAQIKKTASALVVLSFGLLVLFSFLSVYYEKQHFKFDDSFITYRYAANLAAGDGLSWNPGEQPTEGFTSLLHLLLLGPLQWTGLDPLWTTRALNIVLAFSISGILYLFGRGDLGAGRYPAALAAIGFMPLSATFLVSVLGLETVLFSTLGLLSFYLLNRFLKSRRPRDYFWTCISLLLTFLARPEGLLFMAVFSTFALLAVRKQPALALRVVSYALLFLVLPLGVFFLWKKYYFGFFFPNAFHIKAGGTQLVSVEGVRSVYLFYRSEVILLIAALASLLLRDHRPSRLAGLAALTLIGCFTVFYLHVETLMDFYGRFMYPMAPFLYFLALPLVIKGTSMLLASVQRDRRWIKVPAAIALLVLVTFVPDRYKIRSSVENTFKRTPIIPGRNHHDVKRTRIGKKLREYPAIRDVRLALGDAGEIPYYSGAKVLDVVGLNDSYISREKDFDKLVDYFFEKKPDVVIHPSQVRSRTWLRRGHGPLGNYDRWSSDPRWLDFHYAGTVITDIYFLEFFVRKDSPHYPSLSEFIRDNIAERQWPKFPHPLGTSR